MELGQYQEVSRRATARLPLEVDVGERLPVGAPDGRARVVGVGGARSAGGPMSAFAKNASASFLRTAERPSSAARLALKRAIADAARRRLQWLIDQ